jgi:Ca2+-binding RTX toxin-like protein
MFEEWETGHPWVERVRLEPDAINGVAPERLTIGAGGDATIRFVDEVAAYQSALGVYLIGPDGTIHDPRIAFARIEAAAADPRYPFARPGGGPLAAGDAVQLSELYSAEQLAPGTSFGLFLVVNGAARGWWQGGLLDNSGDLVLVDRATGEAATIYDPAAALQLRHIAADGEVTAVRGNLIHTADPTPDDPLDNSLNYDGVGRVVSLDDPTGGGVLLSFEDGRDFDFNDLVVAVEPVAPALNPIVGSDADDLLAGTAGPDRIEGREGADELIGGAGDDLLEGGGGADILYGDEAVPTGQQTLTTQAVGQDLSLTLSAPASAGHAQAGLSGLIAPAAFAGPLNVALVVDVSGSMAADLIGTVAVGDLNGDGFANTRLDALIAGLEDLVKGFVAAGNSSAVKVGLIPFSTDATLSATLSAGADDDGDGTLDLVEHLHALQIGGGTNYDAAFEVAVDFFQGQPAANNLMYFVSDGRTFGAFEDDLALLTDPAELHTTISAFGIGSFLSVPQLELIDSDGAPALVETPEQLSAALTAPPLPPAAMAGVDILLDGSVVASLGADDLQATPLGLSFEATVAGLSTAAGAANWLEVVVRPAADPDAAFRISHEIVGAGNGADILIGGLGEDVLIGGGGADAFVIRTPDDGIDRILDFNALAGDVIDLGELLAAAVTAPPDELVALAAFDDDGDGRADDIALAVDVDAAGPGAATAVAVLIDPVGIAAGTGVQELVDSGALVV